MTQIAEVGTLNENRVLPINELFLFDPAAKAADVTSGVLQATGARPSFADEPWALGIAGEIRLSAELWARLYDLG